MRVNWFLKLGIVILTAVVLSCSKGPDYPSALNIVDVEQTPVERQSIGNCWLYAQASWVESMHKRATGSDFDVSQSYWSYLHWFEQLVGSRGRIREINTGGFWSIGRNLITKYGLIREADFIFEDTQGEMSRRQESALNIVNEGLKSGRYRGRSPAAIRALLDDAWGLSPKVRSYLDSAFGRGLARDFYRRRASATGTPIIDPANFRIAYTIGGRLQNRSLLVGFNDWQEVSYLYKQVNQRWYALSAGEKRAVLQRVQRALHDREPVVISWHVDFNALENDEKSAFYGSFNRATLSKHGPGTQGGHMTVLEDYEAIINTQNGARVLQAGITLDPANYRHRALLRAALNPSTVIRFFRTKNSWGTFSDTRSFVKFEKGGYHDLYMDYLNGSIYIKNKSRPGTGFYGIPLGSFVLPREY